jgi:hypothetical protein
MALSLMATADCNRGLFLLPCDWEEAVDDSGEDDDTFSLSFCVMASRISFRTVEKLMTNSSKILFTSISAVEEDYHDIYASIKGLNGLLDDKLDIDLPWQGTFEYKWNKLFVHKSIIWYNFYSYENSLLTLRAL